MGGFDKLFGLGLAIAGLFIAVYWTGFVAMTLVSSTITVHMLINNLSIALCC